MADQDTSIKASYEGRVTRKRTRKDDTNDSDDNNNNNVVHDEDTTAPHVTVDENHLHLPSSSSSLSSSSLPMNDLVNNGTNSTSKTRSSNRLSHVSRTLHSATVMMDTVPLSASKPGTSTSTAKKSVVGSGGTPQTTMTPLPSSVTKSSIRKHPRKQSFPSLLANYSIIQDNDATATTTGSAVYLGNLRGTPCMTVIPAPLLSNIHIASVRFAKILRNYPLFRRWIYSEFLYNGIDRGFFLHNNFIENLALMNIPQVTKMNRTEWSTIRTVMYTIHQNAHNPNSIYYNHPTNKLSPRKPIRLTRNFLTKELAKLDRYRFDIRRVQMDLVPQLSSMDGPFVYQCPKPYVIGQRVTVIHPGHGHLCTGHISLVDIMYGYCTIQLDRVHDGYLRVSFTDIYPHNELDLLYPALTSIPLYKYNQLYRKQRKQLMENYALESRTESHSTIDPITTTDTDATDNDDDRSDNEPSIHRDDKQLPQQPAAFVPYDPWRLGLDPGYDLSYCTSSIVPSESLTKLPTIIPSFETTASSDPKVSYTSTTYPGALVEPIIQQNKESSHSLYKTSSKSNNSNAKLSNLRYGYSQLDSSQNSFPSVGPSTRIAITEEGDLVLRTFSTIIPNSSSTVDHPLPVSTLLSSSSLSGANTASSLSVISEDNHDTESSFTEQPNNTISTNLHNTSVSSLSSSVLSVTQGITKEKDNTASESLRRTGTHPTSSSSTNMAIDTMNSAVQTLPLLPMNKLGPATTHTVSFAAHCASTLSAARAEELIVIEILKKLQQQKKDVSSSSTEISSLQNMIQYYSQLLVHLRKLQKQAGKATDEAMIQAGLLRASSAVSASLLSDDHNNNNEDTEEDDDYDTVPPVSKLNVSNNSPFLNAIVSTSTTLATDAVGLNNTAKLLHMHTVERLDGLRIRCSIKAKQLTAKTVRNQLLHQYSHGSTSAKDTDTGKLKQYAEELTTQLLSSSVSASSPMANLSSSTAGSGSIVPLPHIKQMLQLFITLQSVHDPGMTLSAVESFISTQRALATLQPVHGENEHLYTRLQGLVTKLRTVQYA